MSGSTLPPPQPALTPEGGPQRRVHVGHRAGVTTVTLDRAPLNVLDLALLRELGRTLAFVSNERPSKVLLLRGAGRAFCAGVDVADHTPERVGAMLDLFHAVCRGLLAMECPTVAVVHGAALGGGCELMLSCDLVLAREDARIGQPEIGLGAFPPAAAALLPRRVGRQRALDLILSGRVLHAGEAEALGLVTRVLPSEGFEGAVEEYVGRLARQSGPVLRLAKRAVTATEELPLAEALAEAERLYLEELMELDDAREGIAAFLEKRPPVWKEA